jgi:hypothetical protein
VDVVYYFSALAEFAEQRFIAGLSLSKFIAEISVGLLKAVPMAAVVAADLAGDEAEPCGDQHPYRHEVC